MYIEVVFQNSIGEHYKKQFESFDNVLDYLIEHDNSLISWRKLLN